MAHYKMVVMSDPVDGREEAYNQWYQNVHLPELLALEGFESARRFRQARTLGQRTTYSYMVEYEIETDDIDAVLEDLVNKAQFGSLSMSDSIDRAHTYAAVYEDIPNEYAK